MKSFKLSEPKRKVIVASILKHRFYKDVDNIREEYANIAKEAMLYSLTDNDKEILRLDKEQKWHYTCNYISLYEASSSYRKPYYYNGVCNLGYECRDWFADLDVVYLSRTVENVVDISSNDDLCHRVNRIEKAGITLGVQVDKAENEIMSVVRSCSTSAQLLKQWPEVEPFLATVAPKEKESKALVVVTDQLNKMLDLPV